MNDAKHVCQSATDFLTRYSIFLCIILSKFAYLLDPDSANVEATLIRVAALLADVSNL